MRKVLLLAAAVVLVAGCASRENDQPAAKAEPGEATGAAAMPAMATVTGTMGCGHCTFNTTSTCAPAVQTDAGVVWILEGVDESSELFQDRYDLGVVKVTGTQRAEAGQHYLKVASYERVPSADDEAETG